MTKIETLRRNLADMQAKASPEFNVYLYTSPLNGKGCYIIYDTKEELQNQIEAYDRKENEKISNWKATETLNHYIEGFTPWMWPVRWIKKLLAK